MKILITGAAGQIGSGLAKRICDKHELTLVDNLRNGYADHLKDAEGEFIAPFHNIDVATAEIYSCSGSYDAIIHLAAISSLPDCETNPLETLHCNVSATANVLDFARKMNVPHVVFASTSAVYENNDVDVFTEDLEVSPRLYYSLSKKMCEDLIESYREHYGSKVTVLRFFNVFGPDGDQTRPNPPLLNFVYRELTKGKAPVLSGDGEQVRDFICIDDVVSMLDLCLEKQPNDVFNVCTGKAVSVNQISNWVAEALGKEDIGLDHKPAGELWDRYPDLFQGEYGLDKNIVAKETTRYSKGSYQKAKDLLGWEPNTDIESEVKRVTLQIK
jgi:UDP-glucose 4-epimerase